MYHLLSKKQYLTYSSQVYRRAKVGRDINLIQTMQTQDIPQNKEASNHNYPDYFPKTMEFKTKGANN